MQNTPDANSIPTKKGKKRLKGGIGILGGWALCLPLFLVLFPPHAQAYLDPGTGNALVYVLVSVATTLVFFLKNFLYSLAGKFSGKPAKAVASAADSPLVIFSEGKIYWPVFKPIVEALMERKYPFRFLSMDIHDPALTIENEYMDSRYIGTGSAAFARAASVRAKVMLETTANIGTPGYPMPVPRHVRCLAHVLHGVGGVGAYYRHAHDTCHALLLMGGGDFDSIRLLEKKRGLPPRECVAAGVPSLDELAKTISPRPGLADPPVILVAPSWGERNSLDYCGPDFVQWLLEAGYHVILRPHPFSATVEAEFLEGLHKRFATHPNMQFDYEISSAASLAAADLMISDTSGVRFDFAFLYMKPVMTLQKTFEAMPQYEFSDLEYIWEEEVAKELGPVLLLEDFLALGREGFLARVKAALSMEAGHLQRLRDKTIANFGCSGRFIADWAIQKCVGAEGTHGGGK
jgi:Putative glycosyl/glycerophosphate transferases involved in teichoic acid biosynthesis TagF/TagB/EpsJ/RodC